MMKQTVTWVHTGQTYQTDGDRYDLQNRFEYLNDLLIRCTGTLSNSAQTALTVERDAIYAHLTVERDAIYAHLTRAQP